MGLEHGLDAMGHHMPETQLSKLIADSTGGTVATAEIILLHGVGSEPSSLDALKEAIQATLPGAFVRSPPAPVRRPDGLLEWFSVAGISEENRPQRVSDARPANLRAIFGTVSPEPRPIDRPVILVGYSQGGIVALDLRDSLAWPSLHVVAIHARWASMTPPSIPSEGRAVMVSSQGDPLFPLPMVQAQVSQRRAHGDGVDHRVAEGGGHGIGPQSFRMAAQAVRELTTYRVP